MDPISPRNLDLGLDKPCVCLEKDSAVLCECLLLTLACVALVRILMRRGALSSAVLDRLALAWASRDPS